MYLSSRVIQILMFRVKTGLISSYCLGTSNCSCETIPTTSGYLHSQKQQSDGNVDNLLLVTETMKNRLYLLISWSISISFKFCKDFLFVLEAWEGATAVLCFIIFNSPTLLSGSYTSWKWLVSETSYEWVL